MQKNVKFLQLKTSNGCSVCAWYITSGGFQLTERLRRSVTLALRARAPTKRTHLKRNQPTSKLSPTHKGDFYNEQTHSKKPEFTHPANPSNQHKNNVTNSQMTAVCALGYYTSKGKS